MLETEVIHNSVLAGDTPHLNSAVPAFELWQLG
jgi:hypothetical protein